MAHLGERHRQERQDGVRVLKCKATRTQRKDYLHGHLAGYVPFVSPNTTTTITNNNNNNNNNNNLKTL